MKKIGSISRLTEPPCGIWKGRNTPSTQHSTRAIAISAMAAVPQRSRPRTALGRRDGNCAMRISLRWHYPAAPARAPPPSGVVRFCASALGSALSAPRPGAPQDSDIIPVRADFGRVREAPRRRPVVSGPRGRAESTLWKVWITSFCRAHRLERWCRRPSGPSVPLTSGQRLQLLVKMGYCRHLLCCPRWLQSEPGSGRSGRLGHLDPTSDKDP